MPPIHLLAELRQLVPSQFESTLLRAGVYRQDKGWTDEVRKDGLLFDLSTIEWVEFGTILQLVLLIESALIRRVNVAVALPNTETRYSEEQLIKNSPGEEITVNKQIVRRQKVRQFLEYIGFVPSLQPEHLGSLTNNLTILLDYDASCPPDKARHKADTSLPAEATRLYEFFFPLTWLTKGDELNTIKISKFLAAVVGQRERGLEAIDADAISNVILYELIDNVATHAGGSGHALVAAWARREGWIYDTSHYIDCERPFVEWLSQLKSSSIEIVVGDSGNGLPKVLKKSFEDFSLFDHKPINKRKIEAADILQWAFDRWSTSRQQEGLRGTRGLYRVDRVVSKYKGLVTLRAENTMAGRDHGGASYDEPVFAKKALSAMPGTIMRCRMSAFHEDSSPRIATSRIPREVTFDLLNLGVIGPRGIQENILQKLQRKLGNPQINQPLCVIAIVEGASLAKTAVEVTLRQCVETRHPGMLVVLGLPGGWALIEGAIDSINSEHEKQARGTESAKPEHFHIWDPVLVIGPQGQFGWVGADKPIKAILEYLLASTNGIISNDMLRQLVPQKQARAAGLKYFRSDNNLIRIHENQNLELLVTGSEIVTFAINLMNDYVTSPTDKEGILKGGTFRTPSLLLVNRWLNVETIVEKTCGSELAMFALSQHLKLSNTWKQMGPANTILADSTVSAAHLGKLQEYLGTDLIKETIPGETGAPIPPTASILRNAAQVIVYCDVMAASEAVGRCLRLIRREGAQAIAIACLIDARENHGLNHRVHDFEVPVIWLMQMNIIQNDGEAKNINPITRRIEEPLKERPGYTITKQDLKKLIQENNALHFSHIGRPIGRHFTFYLNALPFFDSSLIRQSFNVAIDSALETWAELKITPDDSRLELWHPSPEPKPSEPARRFAEMIRNARHDIGTVKSTRRESAYGQWVFSGAQESFVGHPTVVVIDWGALTGTTVMQGLRLAAEAGAKRVLVCVFLSQLRTDEEAFLRSIRTVGVKSLAPIVEVGQIQPLPFEHGKPNDVVTHVLVKFLAGYPVEAYSRYECPVCQQLDRLSQEDYPTELLKDFAIYQKETRLRLRTREQVLARNPQDFDDKPIPVESTLWMLEFRGKLVEALVSTAIRVRINDQIGDYSQDLRSSEVPDSEVLWLLQFLSIESQWLRRPPLYFRRLRDIVSEIALTVSLNEHVLESHRLNAVIVLRTSNKSLFAKNFSRLFEAANNSEQMMRQLLYDAFTYVSRPYHQTEEVFQPLRDQLRMVRAALASGHDGLTTQSFEAIAETVESILQKAEVRLVRAQYRSMTAIESWTELRRLLVTDYEAHRAAPEAMARMLSELQAYESQIQLLLDQKVSDTNPTLSVAWLRRLQKNWVAPRDFLGNTLIELLARLRRVLESDDSKTALGHESVEQFIGMID